MDKKIIFLLFFFIFSNCKISKNTSGLKLNKDHPTFLETDEFGIRVKPILNREYLIFLNWYIQVYGNSYPEKILSILPENLLKKYDSHLSLEERLQASNSSLKDYIFNSKYIDYPLSGLSSTQVLEMQKWMSDRYNENALIELGIYNFNTLQIDEDCFTIEAFLAGQYMGDLQKDMPVESFDYGNRIWRKEYLPTFRLPYQNELNCIKNYPNVDSQLKEYSFDENDFLWKWNNELLKILPKESKIILKDSNESIEVIVKKDITFKNIFIETYLHDNSLEFINTRYLDLGNLDGKKEQYEGKYPYEEKGYFGEMEFVVVGIDEKNRPIIADRLKLGHKEFPANRIFRIAYNKTLETQYLPK